MAHFCSVSVRYFVCHIFFSFFFLSVYVLSTAEGSHQGRAALHWALVLTAFLFTKIVDVSLLPPPTPAQKPIYPVKISQDFFNVVLHDNYRPPLPHRPVEAWVNIAAAWLGFYPLQLLPQQKAPFANRLLLSLSVQRCLLK